MSKTITALFPGVSKEESLMVKGQQSLGYKKKKVLWCVGNGGDLFKVF